MSKSRAKRKRQQRARAAGTAQRGRRAATGGVQTTAKAATARGTDGAKGRAHTTGAKGRADAGGANARDGSTAAKARGRAKGATQPSRGAAVPRPDPIWAPFPLTEIGMGVGIVIFGVGYLTAANWLIAVGAVVLAVVVGELCVREHFAAFRSHALLLAALAVATAHSLVFAITGAYRGPVALAVDLAIGGALAWWLRGRFRAARERAGAG